MLAFLHYHKCDIDLSGVCMMNLVKNKYKKNDVPAPGQLKSSPAFGQAQLTSLVYAKVDNILYLRQHT